MDPLSQLSEHLKFLAEIGVDGFSRDAAWRASAAAAAATAKQKLRPTPDTALRPTPADPDGALAPAEVGPALRAGRDEAASTSPLVAIREDLGDCTRCKLHGLGRKQIVFGVGNPNADLMFVGEAPGRDEDIQGIPFVGRAGQLLTKMIEAMGYTRDQVYIANVLKCRPPENRNPEADEVAACEPFLFRQVEAIRPKVIVALGTFAAQALLKTQDSISRLRGRTYVYADAKLIPTFHPAYLLRSPDRKRDAWEDLKRARAILQETE